MSAKVWIVDKPAIGGEPIADLTADHGVEQVVVHELLVHWREEALGAGLDEGTRLELWPVHVLAELLVVVRGAERGQYSVEQRVGQMVDLLKGRGPNE